jgi:hypothetical protein
VTTFRLSADLLPHFCIEPRTQCSAAQTRHRVSQNLIHHPLQTLLQSFKINNCIYITINFRNCQIQLIGLPGAVSSQFVFFSKAYSNFQQMVARSPPITCEAKVVGSSPTVVDSFCALFLLSSCLDWRRCLLFARERGRGRVLAITHFKGLSDSSLTTLQRLSQH